MDEIRININVDGGDDAAQTIADLRQYVQGLNGSLETNIKDLTLYRSSLNEVNNSIKGLQQIQKEGIALTDTETKRLQALTMEQADLKQAIAEQTQTVKAQIKEMQAAEGSYDQLNALLGQMRDSYRKLSEAERESAKGQEMLGMIKEMDAKMKELDADMGNYQRNVGNYEGALSGLIPVQKGVLGSLMQIATNSGTVADGFKNIGTAVKGFGKQLLALMANPVVAILGVIAVAIMAITKAINSNEEQTNRMKVALAPLNRVMSAFLSVIQKGVGYIIDMVEAGGKLLAWVMKMAEKLPIVGEKIKEMNEAMAESIELERAEIALQKKLRDDQEANAERELEVARLRANAEDKSRYSAQERLTFIRKANIIEQEIAKSNYDNAMEELRIAEARAKWAQNSTEEFEKLTAARVKATRAQLDYENTRRALLKKEQTILREINAEEDARKKKRDDDWKQIEERLKTIDSINERIRQAQMTQTERELEILRTRYEEELALMDEFGLNTTALTEQYEKDRTAIIQKEADARIAKADEESERRIEAQTRIIEAQTQATQVEQTHGATALENIRTQIANNEALIQALLEGAEQKRQMFEEEMARDDISAERKKELAELQIELDRKVTAEHERQTKKKEELDKKYQKQLATSVLQTISITMESGSAMMNAMADLYEEGSEEQKKFQIAGAVMNGLAGVANAISSAMQLPPFIAPIIGAMNAATVIATTATQIKKIKSGSKEMSGASGGSGATPSVGSILDTQAYAQQMTTEGTINLQQQADTRVYVVESDITNAQNAIRTQVAESSF